MGNLAIATDTLTYSRGSATQDVEALIQAHSGLVRRVAWQVHSRMSTAIEIADLMQIGMVALVEASKTFEDRGLPFAPYAAARVRGAMIDQLRKEARICRSGMANRRRIAEVRTALENQLFRQATDAEMANAMELELADYHTLVQSSRGAQQESLDEVYSDHDLWFADAAEAADTHMEKIQLNAALAEHISRLGEREAMILQLYFVEELNLDEIGETLGVGAARICQIKKAALDKLRTFMTDWSN